MIGGQKSRAARVLCSPTPEGSLCRRPGGIVSYVAAEVNCRRCLALLAPDKRQLVLPFGVATKKAPQAR